MASQIPIATVSPQPGMLPTPFGLTNLRVPRSEAHMMQTLSRSISQQAAASCADLTSTATSTASGIAAQPAGANLFHLPGGDWQNVMVNFVDRQHAIEAAQATATPTEHGAPRATPGNQQPPLLDLKVWTPSGVCTRVWDKCNRDAKARLERLLQRWRAQQTNWNYYDFDFNSLP
jgi:hypothetical protein